MGESKIRKKNFDVIKREAKRCVYCGGDSDFTIEHMPPKLMFDAFRPRGLEFASCQSCNRGTKGADAVASFLSRLGKHNDDASFWQSDVGKTLIATVDRDAPGIRSEIFESSHQENVWGRNKFGLFEPKVVMFPEGFLLKSYMNAFSSKIAMALYREHVGEVLPSDGVVETVWYLNSGLTAARRAEITSIMPSLGELRQGKMQSRGEFYYQYNTDKKSIVCGLVNFRNNLNILFFSYSREIGLNSPILSKFPFSNKSGVGAPLVTIRNLFV